MELESVGRILGACAVIGIVLYGLRCIARRARRTAAIGGSGGRIVAVLETTVLPNATSLHVVRVADRYYLIGRGAAQLATLCEIAPEGIAVARSAAERRAHATEPFARWFSRSRASPTPGG